MKRHCGAPRMPGDPDGDLRSYRTERMQKTGGVREMAKCEVCGKSVAFGLKVSHSNRKTNRVFKPNVKKVKAVVDGTHKSVYVCSRCLRSNKIQRA